MGWIKLEKHYPINNEITFVKTSLQPTLSGVDEKPQQKAPIIRDYRGFLFYSMLTAPGVLVGCKVADFFVVRMCTVSYPAGWVLHF